MSVTPAYGRHDKTGRSSVKSGAASKRRAQWVETPFVPMSRALLESPAYRSLSPNGRRVLDRLMVEHMANAGMMNGQLVVTYDQLVAAGCSRRLIGPALQELSDVGLVVKEQQGGIASGSRTPNRYRITFLPDAHGNPPTHDWKRVTKAQVKARALQRAQVKQARKAWREQRQAAESPEI